MSFYFDQLDVWVDSSGILAESINVDSSNEIAPVYSIGNFGISNQVPEGPIKNQFRFSYFPKLDSEPFFAAINAIKNLTGTGLYTGISIVIGGVTGYNCHLDSLSLKATPNELVKANVSFVSYVPMSGALRSQITGNISSTGISGLLPHGWTVQVLSGNAFQSQPIYDLSYDFTASWQPLFILGQTNPVQMALVGGEERFQFTRDIYHLTQFTGEETTNSSSSALIYSTTTDKSIDFQRYDFISNSNLTSPSLVISISGSRIKSNELQIRINDIARTLSTVQNFF